MNRNLLDLRFLLIARMLFSSHFLLVQMYVLSLALVKLRVPLPFEFVLGQILFAFDSMFVFF